MRYDARRRETAMGIYTLYCTVALPRRDNTVLLGRKTEKIGVGLYNGAGGVIEEGEKPCGATIRELFEETGLRAHYWNVEPVAVVDCHNKKDDGTPWICRLYVSQLYHIQGEPKDSSELIDQRWFPTTELPLNEMLPGDRSWMPLALLGACFTARVHYGPGLRTLEQDTEITRISRPELNRLWTLP